jgi:hypothetical protein
MLNHKFTHIKILTLNKMTMVAGGDIGNNHKR